MTKTALIVDDRISNIDVIMRLLEIEGIIPYSVTTPTEIQSVLDEVDKVDLVFLDLEFPQHDGLELVTELQLDERLSGIPFIAYTVHISEQNEAREAGFHSFLGKPLNVERFPDQIRRIILGEPVWEI